MMTPLSQMRVAVIAADGVEDLEINQPSESLRQEGACVEVISPGSVPRKIQTYRGREPRGWIAVDRGIVDGDSAYDSIDHCSLYDALYDALILPGGALQMDVLRTRPLVLEFVRAIDGMGKPIAMLSHGPLILLSAGIIRERKLTGPLAIQADIVNAGGIWMDREWIVDENWISTRSSPDLTGFCAEMLELFSKITPSVIQISASA